MAPRVVLDTNVFVAAGFKPASASAHLLHEIRKGRLALLWSRETRDETERMVRRIPKLRWDEVAPLFRPEGEHRNPLDLGAVGFVEDPTDRKFAALALATETPLVSADDHLLAHRDRLPVTTAAEFLRERLSAAGKDRDEQEKP